VVYVTPEKFFKENGEAKVIFSNLLENRQVGLLAIDEVHLVKILNSFRSAFIHIFVFRHTCPCQL
jgi:superfamily II DNA helicase RecQ